MLLVKAPCASQCAFCAPTLIGEPSSACLTPGIHTKGGQTTRSTPFNGERAGLSALANSLASAGVLNIFQFPATMGKRIESMILFVPYASLRQPPIEVLRWRWRQTGGRASRLEYRSDLARLYP